MKPDSMDKAADDAPLELLQLGELVSEGPAADTDEVSRRRFLGMVGTSVALAGAVGCVRPAYPRKIYPYTTQPDEITPGVPLYFASAVPLAGYGTGVLVRSNEGRPTKIEGNPEHPSSLGGAGLFALASTLDLYDPDRSRGATHKGVPTSTDQAIAALRKQLDVQKAKRGAGLRIVTETVTSPTLAAHIGRILAEFPDARWVQHDAAGTDNIRAGTAKAFGRTLNITYDFAKADVIVSLDADFLTTGPGAARYSRDFADRRKIRQHGKDAKEIGEGSKKEGVKADQLNRLYALECMPTPTGSVADHRLAITSGLVESFARALAAELGVAGVPAGGPLPDFAKAWLKPLADDLKKPERKGKCIVVAGDHQPASLHALAAAINAHLDSFGKTVFLSAPVEARPDGKVIDLKTLVGEMAAKQVDVLLVLGCNPAYTSPADVDFAGVFRKHAEEKSQLLKKVAASGKGSLTTEEQRSLDYFNAFFSLQLGTHQDETSVLCEWHVPEAHFLEVWGDIRGHDGTACIQQPLIAPLYHGKSILEFLAATFAIAGVGQSLEGYDLVRAFWQKTEDAQKIFPEFKKPETFEIFWQETVRAGVVAGTGSKPETVALAGTWASGAPAAPPLPAAADIELNFRTDPTLYDGRFANNGWLQEVPKPISKLTWDNAAILSSKTADKLGIEAVYRWTAGEHGRVEVAILELDLRGKKVKVPAWILPGHADNAVTIHLGYGRERAGKVNSTADEPNADGQPFRGFNAYALRTTESMWTATGATLTKTNKTYYLACTQAHWVTTGTKDPISGVGVDRKPVRYGTLEEYKAEPAFAKVPPMAAAETHEINDNVPHPSHGQEDGAQEDKHALTMYYDNEKFERFTPGLKKDQQRRWAIAIDLSACTGCSACVVACVSENNIPVVGKYEVTRGREMHWIRIDRYYVGKPDDAKLEDSNSISTLFQPVMCVQCENAPCEIVCPVGATVHSADGLNDMTYNRCVGTRYCSNNCPYKVRRFNFLTFQDWDTNTLKLGRNPDVSVRSRGVMEKCTFCVQRIRGAEIVAEREARSIRDGEIVTACQAACPSGAIVFGDLNDSHSAVATWKNEPRNYGLLAELNTRPRLTHLAVVRNPNPAMPKGA